VSVVLLWPACGGETLNLPTCVPAPAPAVESTLEDSARDLVRQHAFEVSCGVLATHFGSNDASTCAGSATSCAEWLSCASGGHCPDYCADHPGTWCDADRVVKCDAAPSATSYGAIIEDCVAEDMHCVNGSCTTGTPCSPTALLHCNGTRVEACYGTLYSKDCAPSGTCVESDLQDGVQFFGCVPVDRVCSPPSAPMCDGNTMNACVFGESVSLDCTAPPYSGTCAIEGGATCVAGPGPCTDGDADRCDGAVLEHCLLDQWWPVDCTTIGFSSCTNGACTK
jgi:hypothetical protein